jgi:hypothetical protein
MEKENQIDSDFIATLLTQPNNKISLHYKCIHDSINITFDTIKKFKLNT